MVAWPAHLKPMNSGHRGMFRHRRCSFWAWWPAHNQPDNTTLFLAGPVGRSSPTATTWADTPAKPTLFGRPSIGRMRTGREDAPRKFSSRPGSMSS
jgi:hypothetical protein